MIDCPNVTVRDALPEYLHDALDPEVAAEIRAHLDGCSACTAELAVMQAVVITAPRVPVIDVSRIAATIPAYSPVLELRPKSSVRPKRTMFESARWRMAAGFLVAAIGVSAISVTRHGETWGGEETKSAAVSPTDASSTASTGANENESGLSIVGVSGLTDDQLAQLTRDLDGVEATPMDEPESEVPAAMDGGL